MTSAGGRGNRSPTTAHWVRASKNHGVKPHPSVRPKRPSLRPDLAFFAAPRTAAVKAGGTPPPKAARQRP